MAEFRRTGNGKHLEACAIHVAAMRAHLLDRIPNEKGKP
jgi:hypothetical protein